MNITIKPILNLPQLTENDKGFIQEIAYLNVYIFTHRLTSLGNIIRNRKVHIQRTVVTRYLWSHLLVGADHLATKSLLQPLAHGRAAQLREYNTRIPKAMLLMPNIEAACNVPQET